MAEWLPGASDAMAASLLLGAPADPARPATVNVFGAMTGTSTQAAALLDELVERAGVAPPPRS